MLLFEISPIYIVLWEVVSELTMLDELLDDECNDFDEYAWGVGKLSIDVRIFN